jgi:hypothetical protein
MKILFLSGLTCLWLSAPAATGAAVFFGPVLYQQRLGNSGAVFGDARGGRRGAGVVAAAAAEVIDGSRLRRPAEDFTQNP